MNRIARVGTVPMTAHFAGRAPAAKQARHHRHFQTRLRIMDAHVFVLVLRSCADMHDTMFFDKMPEP